MRPLEAILNLIDHHSQEIESWFEKKWKGLTPLPYFSCDIRHAQYKFSIVDTNLFPAGFNNLCAAYSRQTKTAFDEYFRNHYPKAKNIALLGEAHTRNKFYLQNLLKLKHLIENSHRKCFVTLPLEHWPNETMEIALDEKDTLTVHQPVSKGRTLTLANTKMDLILANNDFSSGIPKVFSEFEELMIPPVSLGWQKRSKSNHFLILCELLSEFCENFSLDPWLLCPVSEVVTEVSEENLAELSRKIDKLLSKIKQKHEEYKLTEDPYVFVKNDSGTYGLGLLTLTNGKDLLTMNRKQKNKLFSKKGANQNERFLIQEGVLTADTYSGYPIETVIYGIGKNAVGGFFRFHKDKDPFESLNAPGMEFSCLCLHKLDEPHESQFIRCKEKEKLVKAAGFLVKFASLAAAKE